MNINTTDLNVELPSPLSTNECILDDTKNYTYYIIGVIIISAIIFYLYKYQKPINEGYINMDELIQDTHQRCPIQGNKTEISACIHDRESNQAFIISACSKECVSHIQESLHNNDSDFKIIMRQNNYILLYNGKEVQYLLPCTKEHMDKINQMVNTTVMDP